ncbi:hypothetical protein RvY_12036-2 [Ramazzottius varieornatus]|uniref:Uncharacterized protein n=1 Tax=Ramazzottius varieornatus TaxID=947166 RepID=A0A1D1VI65_RAMVA|nr:hypothetical protein RvY_12036-2 [Ramazzottius varieornatus]
MQRSRISELTAEIFSRLSEQCRAPTRAFFQAMEEAAQNCSFVVEDLADLPAKEAKNVLTTSFAEKGPFSSSKLCGHPEHREDETLGDYVDELWSLYLPTSFGLVDKTGQLVAVSVMSDLYESSRMDFQDIVARHENNYMDEIMMYLEHLTQKAAPLLPVCNCSGKY